MFRLLYTILSISLCTNLHASDEDTSEERGLFVASVRAVCDEEVIINMRENEASRTEQNIILSAKLYVLSFATSIVGDISFGKVKEHTEKFRKKAREHREGYLYARNLDVDALEISDKEKLELQKAAVLYLAYPIYSQYRRVTEGINGPYSLPDCGFVKKDANAFNAKGRRAQKLFASRQIYLTELFEKQSN